MSRRPTIIVHGATAFTAENLLVYLDTHRDGEEFDLILAGRNQARLDKVKARLSGDHEVVVVDLTKEDTVRGLVARGDVVINIAGAFL